MVRDQIELTDFEMRMLAYVGKARFDNAIEANRNAGRGPSRSDLTPNNHIRGARTEFACSVMVNLFWRPNVGSVKSIDVGDVLNVRSTVLENGRLIIKPDDNDLPFALVIHYPQERPVFRLAGWYTRREAVNNFKLNSDHGDPAYYVPQASLRSTDSLRQNIGVAALAEAA